MGGVNRRERLQKSGVLKTKDLPDPRDRKKQKHRSKNTAEIKVDGAEFLHGSLLPEDGFYGKGRARERTVRSSGHFELLW